VNALVVVEIGGTSVKVGFGENGRPRDVTRTYPTARIRNADPAAALAALITEASREISLTPARVVATVPGFLAHDFDTVLHARNVPELDGHRIATELSAVLGLPVRLERDVVLQLLGEASAGAVAGESEILAVYIGTGIGAAYLGAEGIFRGGGWALELGHIPMRGPAPGEHPESLEHHASGAALAALARRHRVPVASAFLGAGDPAFHAALEQLVHDQALAIVTALTLFSPHRLLLGGGVVAMENFPRAVLESHIRAWLPGGRGVQPPEIVYTSLGWQAAIWGALALDAAVTPASHRKPGYRGDGHGASDP